MRKILTGGKSRILHNYRLPKKVLGWKEQIALGNVTFQSSQKHTDTIILRDSTRPEAPEDLTFLLQKIKNSAIRIKTAIWASRHLIIFWDLKYLFSRPLCSTLLQCSSQNWNGLKKFLLCFQNLNDVENLMVQKSVLLISETGSKKNDGQCSNDIYCTIYKWCAKDLLCQKIRNSTQVNITPKHSSHETAAVLMTAAIRSETFKALEESVKRISDRSLIWNTFKKYGDTSFVGWYQIYSSRSQTSLSSAAIFFHSPHLTLLNFFK